MSVAYPYYHSQGNLMGNAAAAKAEAALDGDPKDGVSRLQIKTAQKNKVGPLGTGLDEETPNSSRRLAKEWTKKEISRREKDAKKKFGSLPPKKPASPPEIPAAPNGGADIPLDILKWPRLESGSYGIMPSLPQPPLMVGLYYQLAFQKRWEEVSAFLSDEYRHTRSIDDMRQDLNFANDGLAWMKFGPCRVYPYNNSFDVFGDVSFPHRTRHYMIKILNTQRGPRISMHKEYLNPDNDEYVEAEMFAQLYVYPREYEVARVLRDMDIDRHVTEGRTRARVVQRRKFLSSMEESSFNFDSDVQNGPDHMLKRGEIPGLPRAIQTMVDFFESYNKGQYREAYEMCSDAFKGRFKKFADFQRFMAMVDPRMPLWYQPCRVGDSLGAHAKVYGAIVRGNKVVYVMVSVDLRGRITNCMFQGNPLNIPDDLALCLVSQSRFCIDMSSKSYKEIDNYKSLLDFCYYNPASLPGLRVLSVREYDIIHIRKVDKVIPDLSAMSIVPPSTSFQRMSSVQLEPGSIKTSTLAKGAPFPLHIIAGQVPADGEVTLLMRVRLMALAFEPRTVGHEYVQYKPPIPEEIESTTAATDAFDFDNHLVEAFIQKHNLVKLDSDRELDYSRRVFLTIGKNLTHKPNESHICASHVLQSGGGDSEALNMLFVTILRKFKIPAIMCYGQKIVDVGQTEAHYVAGDMSNHKQQPKNLQQQKYNLNKKEGAKSLLHMSLAPSSSSMFLMHQVGWVPCDQPGYAAIVSKRTVYDEEIFSRFGHTEGNQIFFNSDPDALRNMLGVTSSQGTSQLSAVVEPPGLPDRVRNSCTWKVVPVDPIIDLAAEEED